MFAYYAQKGCDPLTSDKVSNSNQLIPFFVMEILGYSGLPGLFISCLFSGVLSTMSSCLNALSADILKPVSGEKVTERAKTWIIKLLVAVYGAAGVGFEFMAKNLGGTVLQGCVIGGYLGLALPLWISIGAYNLPSSGYSLEFPTDNCTSDAPFFQQEEVDPKYLILFFDRLFCCLPESWRQPCMCGYKFQRPEDIMHERDQEIVVQNGEIVDRKLEKKPLPEHEVQGNVSCLAYRQSNTPQFVYINDLSPTGHAFVPYNAYDGAPDVGEIPPKYKDINM